MGLTQFLGMTVTSAEPDRVVAELIVAEEHCTIGHTIHGGAIMAFADTLGALGTVLNLRDGQSTTTLESKTNFFAGAPVGSRAAWRRACRCIAAAAPRSGKPG